MTSARLISAALSAYALVACGREGAPSGPASPSPAAGVPSPTLPAAPSGVTPLPDAGGVPYATSRAQHVMWKRYAALEADLARALELPAEKLCSELGGRSCIRDIHTLALGGNDAFRSGILRPPSEPLTTTPLVVDRVLLSACAARVRRDQTGDPKVFDALDLRGPAPSADTPAAKATLVALFQRFLARDPEPAELEALATLLDPDTDGTRPSAAEFATLACLSVGSSLEFLFQ